MGNMTCLNATHIPQSTVSINTVSSIDTQSVIIKPYEAFILKDKGSLMSCTYMNNETNVSLSKPLTQVHRQESFFTYSNRPILKKLAQKQTQFRQHVHTVIVC